MADAREAIDKALHEKKWKDFQEHVDKRTAEGYITTPDELDKKFDAILTDKDSLVFGELHSAPKKTKYTILNESKKEVSIIDGKGVRHTVFEVDRWTIEGFKKHTKNEALRRRKRFVNLGKIKDL